MTTGTKSVLFGAHQCLWHPITVWLAWRKLYGKRPTWRETVCIAIHDLGYLGQAKMKAANGERHVELGSHIAGKLFGPRYAALCLLHSRHYARAVRRSPSPLCWADKASILSERWWTYLPRAWLSGELAEYRHMADRAGSLSADKSHREWFRWIQSTHATLARERRGDAVPYRDQPTGAPL